MGVPIVLCTTKNKPHTSSHHFSIFPNGLPGYIILVLFDCTFCSIINPPFHPQSVFPSADFPPFIYLIHKPTHGGPTLHQFSSQLVASQAKPSRTGAPISVSVHSSQIILYLFGNCKNPLFPAFT
jgi:hypothetical protein